jgi:hypothetical protein
MKEVSKENKMIIPYSLIKIKAKSTLPYSTLKPLTNSDSPSAKSNGARLHSATQDKNQQKIKGRKIKRFIEYFIKKVKLNLFIKIRREKIIKDKEIS